MSEQSKKVAKKALNNIDDARNMLGIVRRTFEGLGDKQVADSVSKLEDNCTAVREAIQNKLDS